MLQNTFDDKSALVLAMAWCHQATSYYLSQCFPRYMSTYIIFRPRLIKHWWGNNTGNLRVWGCCLEFLHGIMYQENFIKVSLKMPASKSIQLLPCGVRDDHHYVIQYLNYRQTSNTIRTIAGNTIVDHSDVVGASPVGAAPTTSLFSA